MNPFVKRQTLELSDRLRFSPWVRGVVGRCKLLADALARPQDSQARARSIARLCAVARLAPDDETVRQIEHRIQALSESLDPVGLDWEKFLPSIKDLRVTKAAILKPWVGPTEKGVVFVSFEDQWARLLRHCDLAEFARRYMLVVSPTWCPPHSLVNVLFPQAYPGPIFCLISNRKDLDIFPRLSEWYRMIPLYASSWVNPANYRPAPRNRRDIDIVMIANFGTYKRHHTLFRALARMPGHVRATLIGQKQDGRTPDTIRAEARAYGVEGRVTILSSVPNETLEDCLCRAKVSVILSRREGSCVAVAEALFADTPVVLLEGAEVGSAEFINESTGRFVNEAGLAEGLLDVLARHETFAPRAWAEAHISCHQSSKTLNQALRTHAAEQGQPWTRDIAPLCWRPDPQLLDLGSAPWLAAEWEWARTHLGVELGLRPAACVSADSVDSHEPLFPPQNT